MANVVRLPYVPNPDKNSPGDYMSRKGRPILFQILAPATLDPLYPVMLALHVNPHTFEQHMAKTKTVTQTVGAYVEFVWADELDSISAQSSTGAFLSPDAGLVSSDNTSQSSSGTLTGRHGTMAWERQEDLLELFRSNGCVYNSSGQPVIRGRVLCVYDRGAYIGYFTTFGVDEEGQNSYTFSLSWEFKVEKAIHRIPLVSKV